MQTHLAHTYPCSYRDIHTYTNMHTYADIHIHTHTHTYTTTHVHIHTHCITNTLPAMLHLRTCGLGSEFSLSPAAPPATSVFAKCSIEDTIYNVGTLTVMCVCACAYVCELVCNCVHVCALRMCANVTVH